ncbi:MAG TPA: hypothetical protein VGH13_04375 [Xanthobacteraceae bacterium]|jgi:hypothetical protein
MKLSKKSSSYSDKDSVPGGNFPALADKLSEMGNLWKLLNSPDSVHVAQDENVGLIGKPNKLLSGSKENPSPGVERDCKTLSAMDLRRKYKSTEISHRKMLERAPTQGRTVNPAWKKFRDFLRDRGPRPKGTTLDRTCNTDPEYGPGKCRWATRRVQNNNKGDTLFFVHSVTGEKWTASQLAKRQTKKGKPLTLSAIEKRRARGWSDDEIIEGARRAPFLRLPTPNSTPTTPPVPDLLPTASKAAKTLNERLADFWEFTMRELKPDETAPLTGRERGCLASFRKYLDEAGLHDKIGIIEFILRNWCPVCAYVCKEIGWSRGPASPEPGFLTKHARHFVNYVKIAYKPEDISKLQVVNDDEPWRPENKPVGAPKIKKQQPKGDVATLEDILADPYDA